MTRAADTSVLVPALLSWHAHHPRAAAVLPSLSALPAHVLVETYSVLTRLPAPHRVAPRDAARALAALCLEAVVPTGQAHRDLITRVADLGIVGGAVHDALIGTTAREHGLTLVTADRRARRSYEAVGARCIVVELGQTAL